MGYGPSRPHNVTPLLAVTREEALHLWLLSGGHPEPNFRCEGAERVDAVSTVTFVRSVSAHHKNNTFWYHFRSSETVKTCNSLQRVAVTTPHEYAAFHAKMMKLMMKP